MKVLVTDLIDDEGIRVLERSNHQVDVCLDLSPQELLNMVGSYDAMIVRSATKVTEQVFEAAANLKIVGRAGVSVDNIDLDAATRKGVIVCNAPAYSVVSSAEHALAMMLAMSRRVPQACTSMKAGEWKSREFVGNDLYGKTLAIFGLGRVGALVAERARSFGMKVIGHDPFVSADRAAHLGVTLYADVKDVLPKADFIDVHLPKNENTLGMIGADEFKLMKKGVYLVNNAFAGFFDEEALVAGLQSGKVAGVAVDVFEEEPCCNSPLRAFDNALLTPRINADTKEAQARSSAQIAEYVCCGLAGEVVATAVNYVAMEPEVSEVINPYISACRAAGFILRQLTNEPATSLKLHVAGRLTAYDTQVLGAATLSALIDGGSDEPVTLSNASALAAQRGLILSMEKDPQCLDYSSAVSFELTTKNQVVDMACTHSGSRGEMRIISLFNRKCDFVAGKNPLILEYVDEPGKVGAVGSVLGDNGVNISTMQISHNPGEEMAMALINVDSPIAPEVQAHIDEVVGVVNSWYIQL